MATGLLASRGSTDTSMSQSDNSCFNTNVVLYNDFNQIQIIQFIILYVCPPEHSFQLVIIQNSVLYKMCTRYSNNYASYWWGGQMKFDLLPPKQSVCILYFWCEAQRICATECKVGSGCSAQSCNQRVVQLQANHRHRWPRIVWEERQRWVKTGHNKRNQEHIIIRHNYVAVGSGRRGGQGDGWARSLLPKSEGMKQEIIFI